MSVDTPEQLKGLRRAGRVVALALQVLKDAVAPGVSTGELDRIAADVFASHGARSGPILTYGYPGSICISVDEQVVHGVPGERVLEPGELVSLDVPRRSTDITPTRRSRSRSAPSTSGGASSLRPPARP